MIDVCQSYFFLGTVHQVRSDVLGQQLTRKVITDPVPEELQDRKALLDRSATVLGNDGIKCETLLIRGDPAPAIIREAD